MDHKAYSLEVEVGEISRVVKHSRVLPMQEYAVTFIKALNENGIYPHILAIANRSTHGNTYDAQIILIEQVSVDILVVATTT